MRGTRSPFYGMEVGLPSIARPFLSRTPTPKQVTCMFVCILCLGCNNSIVCILYACTAVIQPSSSCAKMCYYE